MISVSNASAIPTLTPAQMVRCLDELRMGFDAAEVIYQRENRIVIRSRRTGAMGPLVIKMWSRPDLKGTLRRILRISSCAHEWRTLVHLRNVNMTVPQPLGFCHVTPSIAGYTDALFIGDLGECESATNYLKQLIYAGQEEQVVQFENVMIEMTKQILDAGMIDIDHGLVNMVVQESGRPVRLDFELARRVVWPQLFTGMYGKMLGHLILLHAFAVQPDTERPTRFASRLCEHLHPPPARLAAREYLHPKIHKSAA